MKAKKMFAVLSAILLIWALPPVMGYAEEGEIAYICAYYDANDGLVGAKAFQENDLRRLLDACAPSDHSARQRHYLAGEPFPRGCDTLTAVRHNDSCRGHVLPPTADYEAPLSQRRRA